MIGIRMAVGRSKHEVNRELVPVDFLLKEKFSIIPVLTNILDHSTSKRVTLTRFIDYAPMVFQRIRFSFGIQTTNTYALWALRSCWVIWCLVTYPPCQSKPRKGKVV